MQLVEIDIKQLHSDPNFNSRGYIAPIDVMSIVKDIEKHGLQNPITIREYSEQKQKETGFKYGIVSGHCRHRCFEILSQNNKDKWGLIPCINKGHISDAEAKILNISENLKRKNLTILQEAHAIAAYKESGVTQEKLAEDLGVSRAWTQVRYNLLDLPPEIQVEAEAGLLNQYQIKTLYGMKDKDKQFAAVKSLKEKAARGEKTKQIKLVGPKPGDSLKRRVRNTTEIYEMMDAIMDSQIGASVITRALAWCAGNINTMELYLDLKQYADDHGLEYRVPDVI